MADRRETRQVFRTGRNPRTLSWILGCAFLFALSLRNIGLAGGTRGLLGTPNLGWLLAAIASGALMIVCLLAYARSSLEVNADGVAFLDWRGRVTSIAWERLREVVLRAQRTNHPRGLTITNSFGPLNIITAWLTYLAQDGAMVRLKITTDSSFKRVNEIAELIAKWAHLERMDEFRHLDRIWARPSRFQPPDSCSTASS